MGGERGEERGGEGREGEGRKGEEEGRGGGGRGERRGEGRGGEGRRGVVLTLRECHHGISTTGVMQRVPEYRAFHPSPHPAPSPGAVMVPEECGH